MEPLWNARHEWALCAETPPPASASIEEGCEMPLRVGCVAAFLCLFPTKFLLCLLWCAKLECSAFP